MIQKLFLAGALAFTAFLSLGSPVAAQGQPTEQPTEQTAEQPAEQQTANIAQANDPRSPRRRSEPEIFEDTDIDPVDGELDDVDENRSVDVFLRLNTELFVNSGDLIEFEVPVRYAPSDRLSMQASPVIKYFPESAEENFDYGFKFAVEYRL